MDTLQKKYDELKIAARVALVAMEHARNVLYVNGDPAVNPDRHSVRAEASCLNAHCAELRIELEKP